MHFTRLQKSVSFGLVGVGLLLIVLSDELLPPVWLAAFAAIGIGWWRWDPEVEPPKRSRATTLVWNLSLTLILLALLALAFMGGNWLLHTVHFGIVMAVSKLFWVQRSRDLFQLYTLSFLLVLGGAVVNPGLSFALLFPVFVVLLTWALILLHLRRDLEQRTAAGTAARPSEPAAPAAAPLWRTRRLVTRSFLLGTSLLALGIFASSLVIFFLFPRLGLGFFHAKTRGGQAVSGFGDEVELGHFGTIRDDDAVVMRIELPDEPIQPARRLRLRGISFDVYDGRAWHKSERGGAILHSGRGGWFDARPWEPPVDEERLLRQEIYLEPLDTGRRVLFGVPGLRYVRRPGAKLKELQERGPGGGDTGLLRFLLDRAGDVGYAGGQDGVAFRYTALSDLRSLKAGDQRADVPIPPHVRERYLQLPATLDPQIAPLAQRLTRGATTPFDKAAAIERALQRDWTYSVEGGHDPADPLSDFLFGRREGHCEYFATAMAVLAREAGVPARIVNGFYGGVWNPYGDYYAIRQADAHSWVEAWIPGPGWMTFDPTPPSGRYARAGSGLLADIEAWIDSLRLSWYKWVIEYDLDKQLGLFEGLVGLFDGRRSPLGDAGSRMSLGRWKDLLGRVFSLRNVAVTATLLVALWLALRLRRHRAERPRVRRPPPRREVSEILRLFARLERRMARRGYPRLPVMSPREWAARVATTGHPSAPALERAARAVEEVVWGGRRFADEHRAALRAALGAVR
jgi:hypothetical protein